MKNPADAESPSDASRQLLLHLRSASVLGLPEAWFESAAHVASAPVLAPEQRVTTSHSALPAKPSGKDARGELLWEALEQDAQGCTRCRLCETRTSVVFGDGRLEQPLVAFVGEGPGAEEDKAGLPFVGRAGELLTSAITKGMGLKRSDVYIANVVKCRPPENRAPLPDETESCLPFLFRQLEILQPRVIVTLGSPAQKAIVGKEIGITKLRGQWHEWRGVKVMPTLHPAYLLRNPAAKRDFWTDIQSVMTELGIPLRVKEGKKE